MNATNEYGSLGKLSMLNKDKFGNPEIDFPVAFIFGEADWHGSEGADEVVRQSKFYSSGESQLFRLANTGHNMHL